METYPLYWPPFYTSTILKWKALLKPAKYKDIIIQSLQHLTATKKITLFAFVIMNNHILLSQQRHRYGTLRATELEIHFSANLSCRCE